MTTLKKSKTLSTSTDTTMGRRHRWQARRLAAELGIPLRRAALIAALLGIPSREDD